MVGWFAWALTLPLAARAHACALHGNALPTATAFQGVEGAQTDRSPEEVRFGGQVGMAYHGRVLRLGTQETGRARLQEQNLLLHAAGYWRGRFGLAVALPLAKRSIRLPNNETQMLQGLGDMTLEVRWRPWVSPPHGFRLELTAGALLPTAPLTRTREGAYHHPDVQLGSGVVTPRASVALVTPARADLQGLLAVDGLWAPESPDGVQRAATLRVHPAMAWRATDAWTLQLGVPLRHEARTREGGEVVASTGGTLISMAPVLRWRVVESASVELGGHLPLVQRLRGGQRERATVLGSLTWSFGGGTSHGEGDLNEGLVGGASLHP